MKSFIVSLSTVKSCDIDVSVAGKEEIIRTAGVEVTLVARAVLVDEIVLKSGGMLKTGGMLKAGGMLEAGGRNVVEVVLMVEAVLRAGGIRVIVQNWAWLGRRRVGLECEAAVLILWAGRREGKTHRPGHLHILGKYIFEEISGHVQHGTLPFWAPCAS